MSSTGNTSIDGFKNPTCIDIDPDGNVHVVDWWRIAKFSPSGTYLDSIPLPEEIFGMAIDAGGNYYLVMNYSIQKWTADGTVLWEWDSWHGDCETSARATFGGCALTPTGDVYAATNWDSQVLHLTGDGELVTYWGREGTNDGEFKYPYFIAIHPLTGYIYVKDLYTSRLQIFGNPPVAAVTPELPANLTLRSYPNPFNPWTTKTFTIAQPAHVSLRIYDVQGRRIVTLLDESRQEGTQEIRWDGTNDQGAAVSSGVYFCRLTVGNKTATGKMVLLK